jgi:hypothetical protein
MRDMLAITLNFIADYYALDDETHIELHTETLTLFSGTITLLCTRRALKHIVEQRKKKDNASLPEIQQLFIDIDALLCEKRFSIVTQMNSALLIETNVQRAKGVVLVLEIVHVQDTIYTLKTGFYRAASKLKKLLKQK